MANCTLCTRRPRRTASLYCFTCAREMNRTADTEKARTSTKGRWDRFFMVVAWKGEYVGVEMITPEDNYLAPSKERHVYLGSDVRGIPKDKVVNLDAWQPAYTGVQVKRMKNVIRRLSPFFNLTKTLIA